MSGRGGNKGYQYTKTLRINSSNRTPNPSSTDTNFSIDLGNSLQQVSKISVLHVQIPNVFYNVIQTQQKYNNYFHITWADGGAHTASIGITPGYYSAYDLYTAIADAINAADSDLTLTFSINSITGKVSFTATVGGTATALTIQQLNSTAATNLGLPPRQVGNPFGLLGFDFATFPNSTMSFGAGTSAAQVATYIPNLLDPAICYVTSSMLAPSMSFDEKGKSSNVLVQVSLAETPHGGMAIFECEQDILCEIDYGRPRMLSNVDIQIVDHENDPLDLLGNECNILLRVWLNTY